MLAGIHIQNFRCFQDFRLEGFGQVNLIGGLNNAGKTVLLEAVFLSDLQPSRVGVLKYIRYNMSLKWLGDKAEQDWGDLFYNKKTNQNIKATYFQKDGLSTSVQLFLDKTSIDNSIKLLYKASVEQTLVVHASIASIANEMEVKIDNLDPNLDFEIKTNAALLPAGLNIPSGDLAEKYSKHELEGDEHYILKAVQTIDSTITELKVIVVGEPNIYARRAGEPLLPIEFFGDAVVKLIHIIIGLLSRKNGILLLDEIENGIHYTNQKQVWQLIFKWAKQFNVQVFATTHSREMAAAFNQVALEEEVEAPYIEMARHVKTNQIIGTIMPPNILQHKLEYNQAFRGE